MKTKLLIGLLLISMALLMGCTETVTRTEYVCSDGSVVTEQLSCPVEETEEKTQFIIEGTSPRCIVEGLPPIVIDEKCEINSDCYGSAYAIGVRDMGRVKCLGKEKQPCVYHEECPGGYCDFDPNNPSESHCVEFEIN